ncbi:unnamed protein product [Psylliodes chrysocephalus]|uniref:THIF-type NAD/FAD binding fold domain-containing protein n=1 Tax=Psylliodes chrysocephalus TaxID=3402493 RepID=A0A9P0G8M7_9CUCU|nr:unnamed protein product [Psylliodes chrysocephala]
MAETSVQVDVRTLKWDLLPNNEHLKISTADCLILGAGTLGCAVARSLLSWGVRNITFVDKGNVSTSNPVRQSLFTFQDSIDVKPKAKAAADNLKLICPGVKTSGHQFTIPMPGHTEDCSMDQTVEDVERISQLIEKHDVIFLMLDSRESRWLPTVIAAAKKKMVLNAALSFDSYLVMRHGIYMDQNPTQSEQPFEDFPCPIGMKSLDGRKLGCYFCTDIIAPGDSTKNRPLDQQCTVTRPGVSQIAGALAAEMAVSLIIHQRGVAAPAFYVSNQNVNNLGIEKLDPSHLGIVPHSIRGFVSSYEQFSPATEKYSNCVACSDFVIKQYRELGMKFLFEALNNPKYLEEVAQVPHSTADVDKVTMLNDVYETDVDEEFDDWLMET